MKLGLSVGIFTAGILTFSVAHADENRWLSVDVQSFDIAGVKLGMNLEQARAAAANHFKVLPKEIKAGASFALEVEMNDITQTKLPKYLSYHSKNGGERLKVTFSTRIPVDKAHPLVVDSVEYGAGGSQETIGMLKEAARSKYGTPSFTQSGMDFWCANPQRNVMSCPSSEAFLRSSPGMLTLIDPSYDAAANKYREQLRTVKPNI